MSRSVRDVVITGVTLIVLAAGLVTLDPRLGERAAQVVTEPELQSTRETAQQMTGAAVLVVRGYAGEHTYLFTFLVAACCFVVLMLKVIS